MSAEPESVLDIKPGDVLAGKYKVERILGSGGMGMVVAAYHLQLDERVALKFLLPAATGSLDVIARFMREARAAFKIKSEHIARVTDVAQLENGSPYIVMEYLEGGDLAAWLVQRGPMPIEQGVDFILQACEALAEAHTLGIVHRDLKPANLFCVQRADGQLSIKVLDFGISKVTNEAAQAQSMTQTNGLVGSPLYMSPEHMKSSRAVDARTDIWSLGVILFEIIAGRPPFEAESVTELVLKVAAEPPIPLRRFRPDAPEALEAVLDRCLEKTREARFQDVAELAQALLPFGPAHGRTSVDRIVGTLDRAPARTSLDQSSSELLPVQRAASTLPFGTGAVAPPAMTGQPLAQTGVPLVQGLTPPSQPSMPMTASAWGPTDPPAPANTKAIVGIALGTAIAVMAVVFAVAWPRLKPASNRVAPSAQPAAAASSTAPVAATSPASATDPAPAPPPTASTEAAVIASASASVSAVPSTAPGIARPRPAAYPTRNPCDPPYYVDAKGTHHFKRECL